MKARGRPMAISPPTNTAVRMPASTRGCTSTPISWFKPGMSTNTSPNNYWSSWMVIISVSSVPTPPATPPVNRSRLRSMPPILTSPSTATQISEAMPLNSSRAMIISQVLAVSKLFKLFPPALLQSALLQPNYSFANFSTTAFAQQFGDWRLEIGDGFVGGSLVSWRSILLLQGWRPEYNEGKYRYLR